MNFESQNSHSLNVNFDQLCHITSSELHHTSDLHIIINAIKTVDEIQLIEYYLCLAAKY